MDSRKQTLIAMLHKFIRQRPGLEFCNYGDANGYRAELRSIGKDLQHAQALLSYVEWHDSIGADDILRAAKDAFSGRLHIAEHEPGRFTLNYCTGQYWPTEYRRAVCAVLSSAIWAWFRDHCMPDPCGKQTKNVGEPCEYSSDLYRFNGAAVSAGDFIRRTAKREFGSSIARRWFN